MRSKEKIHHHPYNLEIENIEYILKGGAIMDRQISGVSAGTASDSATAIANMESGETTTPTMDARSTRSITFLDEETPLLIPTNNNNNKMIRDESSKAFDQLRQASSPDPPNYPPGRKSAPTSLFPGEAETTTKRSSTRRQTTTTTATAPVLIPHSLRSRRSAIGSISSNRVIGGTIHNDPDVEEVLQDESADGGFRGSTRYLENYFLLENKDILLNNNTSQDEDDDDDDDDNTEEESRGGSMSELFMKKIMTASMKLKPKRYNRYRRNSSSTSAFGKWCSTHLVSGSLQQSVVVAFVIAIVNGIACWLYYEAMEWALHTAWHTVPERIFGDDGENDDNAHWKQQHYAWVWIPCIIWLGALLVGCSVRFLGEPGDMAYTVACVHSTNAYIPIHHVLPMVVTSFFGITLSATSLGPEAPLVAICGALGGWISRSIFGERYSHVVRKHTLMGMAGALSAFFGCPLGGSIFALEVNSRFGIEYFEHLSESIFCGELTLVVFRSLTGIPAKALWDFTLNEGVQRLDEASTQSIVLGGLLGLVGGGLAYLFALFHSNVMKVFSRMGLLEDNEKAISRAFAGSIGIIIIGLLIPHTLFWAEMELQVLGNRLPASALPHVWPTAGLIGFEVDTAWKTALVGVVKLAAISFTIAGGFRGGFIFPLMFAGGSVGRALSDWLGIPVQLGILCVAAGTNTAITRTALATTLVLAFLAGEQCAFPAILMASLTSLFATGYLKFIKTQIARSDVDHSIFHRKILNTLVDEDEDDIEDDGL